MEKKPRANKKKAEEDPDKLQKKHYEMYHDLSASEAESEDEANAKELEISVTPIHFTFKDKKEDNASPEAMFSTFESMYENSSEPTKFLELISKWVENKQKFFNSSESTIEEKVKVEIEEKNRGQNAEKSIEIDATESIEEEEEKNNSHRAVDNESSKPAMLNRYSNSLPSFRIHQQQSGTAFDTVNSAQNLDDSKKPTRGSSDRTSINKGKL